MTIRYKGGYKYQLTEEAREQTNLFNQIVKTEYVSLYADGIIAFRKGYAWDGASGPAFDTRNIMRGSLVHDGFYQLMRMGLLPEKLREKVDNILHRMCIDDGMNPIRSWWVLKGVRLFGTKAASEKSIKNILTAP